MPLLLKEAEGVSEPVADALVLSDGEPLGVEVRVSVDDGEAERQDDADWLNAPEKEAVWVALDDDVWHADKVREGDIVLLIEEEELGVPDKEAVAVGDEDEVAERVSVWEEVGVAVAEVVVHEEGEVEERVDGEREDVAAVEAVGEPEGVALEVPCGEIVDVADAEAEGGALREGELLPVTVARGVERTDRDEACDCDPRGEDVCEREEDEHALDEEVELPVLLFVNVWEELAVAVLDFVATAEGVAVGVRDDDKVHVPEAEREDAGETLAV